MATQLCPQRSSQTVKEESATVLIEVLKLPPPSPPQPSFPLLVITEDFFYTTEGFEPSVINQWKRLNGWQRPINILMPTLWLVWLLALLGILAFAADSFKIKLHFG
jgi:hypothetical protein